MTNMIEPATQRRLTPAADAIVSGLNDRQREAVTQGDGPVLVVAGAGSGKTRMLTRRIAFLIRVKHQPPWTILAVTFTNKAASEMRERVLDLVGDEGREVLLGTFHAVCLRILRIERRREGLPDFSIYDPDDQRALMKQALNLAGVRDSRMTPGVVLGRVSNLKNELIAPQDFRPRSYADELISNVYPIYQDLLRQNNAFDFDDLLVETVKLLRSNPETLERYSERYRHILVDEYQDTNHAQYALVSMLAAKHQNLFVVGDADQAIYGWRGADVRNILEFEEQFPNATTITLDQNYRSTQNILDAAHAIISVNEKRPEKKLWTDQDRGPLIHIFEGTTEGEEALFIVRQIRRLISRGTAEARSCAVMYRTNSQSRVIEDAFVHEGLPYKIVGTTRFYERREVRDVLAYLRWVANPDDGQSLARIINVPPRKIGATSLSKLLEWASAQRISLWSAVQRADEVPGLGSAAKKNLHAIAPMFAGIIDDSRMNGPLETLDHVLAETHYLDWLAEQDDGDARLENVEELRTVASNFEELDAQDSLQAMLEQIALVSDADQVEESGGAATLMTMHLAKGLEFDVVFLVGMEDGLFPHSRSVDDVEEMEEERRLCYVGITRARHHLYLTYAMSRRLMGRSERNPPSRFLLDIPEGLLTPDSSRPRSRGRNVRDFAAAAVFTERPTITETSFAPGEKVYHRHFGVGTIVSSELSGGDEEVTVAFAPNGNVVTKRLSVMYSGLEHM